MKKSTFLRIAMAFSLILLVSGAFAQVNITVKKSDGTAANGSQIYTKHSSTGAETVIATDGGAGDLDAIVNGVIRISPVAGTNYLLRDAAVGTQWNAYTGVAAATITLSASFNPTIQEYTANRNVNKVTTGKAIPFWAYPSPVQNPAWIAPAALKATPASIATNILSSFAWSTVPVANAANSHAPATDNYSEWTFTPNLTAAITTTSTYEVDVVETPTAAYGGCVGSTIRHSVSVINAPYVRITTAIGPATYQVGGTPVSHIVAGCSGSIAATNIALAAENTNEEFPYYVKIDYKVYNATMGALNNLTLGADVTAATMLTYPALEVQGFFAASHVNNTTNPYRITATPQNLYGAVQTFGIMNNLITVYQFDVQSWNAKISRKCDYTAIRNAAGDETQITDANYTWYNSKWTPATDVTRAYIIVFPQPVTGPIYHIPNSWAL
ncbi:MAG: hypothetical protein HOO91_12270 [Bacteroidales bacterium]|nr:hypothetical protein [Bacteroidales bacterium]